MGWSRRILILVMLIAGILFLGYFVPPRAISTNVDKLPEEEQEYGRQALQDLEIFLSGPSLYKLYTTQFQIIQWEAVENPTDDQLEHNCLYRATVQARVLFGLKSSLYSVDPNCGVSTLSEIPKDLEKL